MHPVIEQTMHVLLLEMKVNPVIQAEQTLTAEHAEQLVLLQVMQPPLRAENPVEQVPH